MDIVIDIQGFRDVNDKFIPKEVAVVAINAPIVGHWIMMPPHPFGELPERVRQENNWLTRNYHGIEWYDGEANPKYFTLQMREITRNTRYIYVRGNEKARYLQNLLSRNIYNLEGISPAFKNLLPEEERGRYCSHHGFRKFGIFHCALRNAYKLKRWLVAQNNCDSSDTNSVNQTTCSSLENWELAEDDENKDYAFNDINENIILNQNIKTQSNNEIEKNNWSKDEQTIGKEEDNLAKLDSSTLADKNKRETPTIFSQTDIENPVIQNTGTDENTPAKEVKTEIIQIIPPVRSSSGTKENELMRNSTSIASSRCQTCGGLSCRQSPEGVDTIDSNCR